jgi:hypothetical protein
MSHENTGSRKPIVVVTINEGNEFIHLGSDDDVKFVLTDMDYVMKHYGEPDGIWYLYHKVKNLGIEMDVLPLMNSLRMSKDLACEWQSNLIDLYLNATKNMTTEVSVLLSKRGNETRGESNGSSGDGEVEA